MRMHLIAVATAALLATSAQAATTSITFTEFGVVNGDNVTTQYQSLGITATNLRQYTDNRDTFDANGLTPTIVPATVNFTSVASNVSIDYVLLAGSSLTVSLFDSALNLLDTLVLPSGQTNLNASYSFTANNVSSLVMSNAVGTFGLSTLTFDNGVVPEPASWAMLISGFGLVGAVARRRRSVVTA